MSLKPSYHSLKFKINLGLVLILLVSLGGVYFLQTKHKMISLAFLIFVLLGAFSLSVHRLIVVRLQKCVAAVKGFGSGNLQQDIPDMGRDEIGELAEAFNQMAANLREHIKELESAEDKLYGMATHDALTKLFNRSFFTIKLEEEFQRAERYKLPLSLIIMDIDNFKLTNDTFGHQAGDAYLESLADLVKGSVRQVDTVARYGGEELVVILPHTEPDGALALAERLRAAVAAHEVSYDGNTIQGTISLGLVSYKEGSAATVDEFLKAADNALYDAKHGGRNRVVVSHEGMDLAVTE